MHIERSTKQRLIASFVVFSCIILAIGIFSLISINRTTESLQRELEQSIFSDQALQEEARKLVEHDTWVSSTIVAAGSVLLIILNFSMTYGGLKFTRKEMDARDRIEQELRESNEKLSSVIEGTNVGSWVYNIPSGIVEINNKWAEITGFSWEELTPFSVQKFQDFIHPDDADMVASRMQDVFSGKLSLFEVEMRMLHKDGHWVWVLARGKITKWSDTHQPMVMSGTHADITGEMRTKLALEKSESSHRKLVEQMNQGLLVCKIEEDADHRMVDAVVTSMNRRSEDILERSAESILNTSVDNIFYGEKDVWIDLFRSVVESGIPKNIERHAPRLGKYLRISAYAPEPLVFAAIIDDITESKQIQDQLALQKARLETTLLSVGDGVVAISQNGQIEIMNSVAQDLTKWTMDEAKGKTYTQVIDLGKEDFIEQSIERKQSVEAGAWAVLKTKQGNTIPVEAIASPIYDTGGQFDGVVLVFRDCTEKRQNQQSILDLSYSDPLTGLKNRRAFERESRRLDHIHYCPLVLVIADVNNLKLTNDAFGHDAGDTLLRTVAGILRRACRETDIVARIGGDEFVLLLPNTDIAHANVIIDRMNDSIAKAEVEGMPISVSFGKSIKLVPSDDMDIIFKEAEHEMYRKKIADRPQIRKRIIDQLLTSLFTQHPEERIHSKHVRTLCRAIAERAGLSDDEVEEISLAGTMHDIGKIAIGTELLENESGLEELEPVTVLRHPEVGYNILSAAPQYGTIAEFVLTHHEKWDGTGYPSGLKGDAIPLQGRILALADSFVLMTLEAPYGFGMSEHDALAQISKDAGTKYDPQLATLLTQLILDKER